MTEIDGMMKTEAENKMRGVAKRVLGSFWRHFKTADGSTQTEDKVVDALKGSIVKQQKEIIELKEQIEELLQLKEKVELSLAKEKAFHDLTRKLVKEKETKIEEIEN